MVKFDYFRFSKVDSLTFWKKSIIRLENIQLLILTSHNLSIFSLFVANVEYVPLLANVKYVLALV